MLCIPFNYRCSTMSNKLYYRLGMEELQVVDEVETPVIEMQGAELEANQLQQETASDVQMIETLHGDMTTLGEAQAALEAALKGASTDREALIFVQKTIQMVDKRWGFDHPTPSMESDDALAIIASMEDGIGQRLKDAGKALLEMLKKVWAKLKEWGGKLLQLIGFRKKKLVEESKTLSGIEIGNLKTNLLDHDILEQLHVDFDKLKSLSLDYELIPGGTTVDRGLERIDDCLSLLNSYNVMLNKCYELMHKGDYETAIAAYLQGAPNTIFGSYVKNPDKNGPMTGLGMDALAYHKTLPGGKAVMMYEYGRDPNHPISPTFPSMVISKTNAGFKFEVETFTLKDLKGLLTPAEAGKISKKAEYMMAIYEREASKAYREFETITTKLAEFKPSSPETADDEKMHIRVILNTSVFRQQRFLKQFSAYVINYLDSLQYYITLSCNYWTAVVNKS